MCYNVAKEIGAMAIALKGKVDAILLTGGIAHNRRLTDFIAMHIDFIAPVAVYPGENELRALAYNALSVLQGEQPLKEYHKRYITAKRADISNTSHGDGAPGASTAAAFLSFFVDPEIKWAHLDLANAYQADSSPYLAAGSTGNTVLALAHWLVGAQY